MLEGKPTHNVETASAHFKRNFCCSAPNLIIGHGVSSCQRCAFVCLATLRINHLQVDALRKRHGTDETHDRKVGMKTLRTCQHGIAAWKTEEFSYLCAHKQRTKYDQSHFSGVLDQRDNVDGIAKQRDRALTCKLSRVGKDAGRNTDVKLRGNMALNLWKVSKCGNWNQSVAEFYGRFARTDVNRLSLYINVVRTSTPLRNKSSTVLTLFARTDVNCIKKETCTEDFGSSRGVRSGNSLHRSSFLGSPSNSSCCFWSDFAWKAPHC